MLTPCLRSGAKINILTFTKSNNYFIHYFFVLYSWINLLSTKKKLKSFTQNRYIVKCYDSFFGACIIWKMLPKIYRKNNQSSVKLYHLPFTGSFIFVSFCKSDYKVDRYFNSYFTVWMNEKYYHFRNWKVKIKCMYFCLICDLWLSYCLFVYIYFLFV
jgi:hypothetical protein